MKKLVPKFQLGNKYKKNTKYSYSKLTKEDRDWIDSFLADYKTRWDATHPKNKYDTDKIKNNINFSFDENSDISYYQPTSNDVVLSSDNKSIWAHELSHALRALQGRNNMVARTLNINEGTPREENLTRTYKLYDPYEDSIPYPYNLFGEPYTVNTELRERISQQNGGVRGDDLNKVIDDYPEEDLKKQYFKLFYTDAPHLSQEDEQKVIDLINEDYKNNRPIKSYKERKRQVQWDNLKKDPNFIKNLKKSMKTVAYNNTTTSQFV